MNRFSWQLARQWAVAGLLGGSVALSGMNRLQADDEKPKLERKEGGRKEGEPKDPAKRDRRPDRLIDGAEVAELRKAISDAALKGNFEEVRRLTERLERLMGDGPRMPEQGLNLDEMQRLRDEMLRSMRGFEEAIERLQGQPEAQDAIRKAMDAYRKAMTENQGRLERRGGFGIGGLARVGDPFAMLNPAPNPRGGALGVNIMPAPDFVTDLLDLPRGLGVIVQSVLANSAADKAGLKRNDLILSFAGEEVSNIPAQFVQLVEKAIRNGKPVDVLVFRKGKKETIKGIEMPKEARQGEAGKIAFQSMSMSTVNGAFKIDAKANDVQYFVAGEMLERDTKLNSIRVTVGEKVDEYKTIKEVPVEHQPAIRQLLSMTQR
jgi:TATA-box binding protein (TBP) (component of TFIID and TFIIIB)